MSDFDTSYPLQPLANAITAEAVRQALSIQANGGLGVRVPPGIEGVRPATDGEGNDINEWFYTVGLDYVDVDGPVIR